jgi:uncharacterized membrane protein
MTSTVDKPPRSLPLNVIGVIVTIAIAYFAILKHYTFHSLVYDYGIFQQVIWNTAHGHPFASSLKHMNYLGDHFSPALGLLAPLEWSPWPDETIIAAQATMPALSGWAMGEIAQRRGAGPWGALAVGLATMLNPLLFLAAFSDIHPEVFVAGTLAVAFLNVERGNRRWAGVLFACALGGKEDVALLLVPLGLALAWEPSKRRFGLILAASAAVWFVLAMTVFGPAFKPANAQPGWFYGARYSHLGGTPFAVVLHCLQHPWDSLASQATNHKGYVAFVAVVPFGLAPFFGWRFLLATLPLAAAHFVSSHDAQFEIGTQYLVPLAVVIAYAACDGMRFTIARWPKIHAVFALGCGIWFAIIPRTQRPDDFKEMRQNPARREAIALIPKDAAACANLRMGAHLSTRYQLDVCTAPNIARDSYAFFHWPLVTRAEWLLFDPGDGWDSSLSGPRLNKLIQAGATVVYRKDGITLLHATPEVLDRAPGT